jgi:Plasmid pRiA4b ORF-3-like protein
MMSPTRQKAVSDSFNEIATVRIELRHTDPLIWRQLEVPTSITLKVLHDIIQAVMGWFDDHLWEFTIGKQKYSLPIDDDWGTEPRIQAAKVRLRDVLEPRKTVIDYTYDFGDGWEHRLTITDVRVGQPGVSYPRYIGGERNGPLVASPASTNCSRPSPIPLIPIIRVSKNGRATTIPTHSMSFRSNMPSVASQTAAMLPRRGSPRKSVLARLPDRHEPTHRGLHRMVRLIPMLALCSDESGESLPRRPTLRTTALSIGWRSERPNRALVPPAPERGRDHAENGLQPWPWGPASLRG